MKLKLILAIVLISMSANLAVAQKNEVGLLLGGISSGDIRIGTTTNGTIQINAGLTFYANYARQLAQYRAVSIHFEVPFAATPSTDVKSSAVSAPRNYASLFITPGVKFKFAPRARLSPYFAIGGGYGRFDESTSRLDDQPNTGRKGTNSGVFDFGGGLDVRIVRWLSLRGEVRDFISDRPNFNVPVESDRQHNVLASGGIVLKF